MSDKPDLGNYLHHIIDEIAEVYRVNWVKPGDVIDCEHCGKKHIVGWDGSMIDVDDLDEIEIEALRSGVSVIHLA